MQHGWVKLHRKVRNHWLFEEKRTFSKFEAWMDLLMEVNHADRSFLLGNDLMEIKVGQTVTSVRKLCDRWGWSNTKVIQFLKLLQSEGMITYKSDTKKTVITVDKYEFYQHESKEETTRNTHEHDTKQTREHTNKNYKELNKNNSPKQTYDESSIYFQLANYLYKKVLSLNSEHKQPNFQKWSDSFRLMMERDNRTEEQIKYVIDWVNQDPFWGANILSPDKLRKQFDSIVIKIKSEKKKTNAIPTEKPEMQGAGDIANLLAQYEQEARG